MTENGRTDSLESRVSSLETELKHYGAQLARLSEEMQAGFRRQAQALDDLGRRSQTNWGTLATWTGVIVGAMSLLGSLALSPVRERVERLDGLLQREMRQLDQVQNERITASDHSLQREIERIDRTRQASYAHLNELLAKLEKRFEKHAALADHPLGVVVQIKELERELKRIESRLDAKSEVSGR